MLHHSEELHFPLDPHKSELFSRSVAVVEEEFVPRLDVSFGEDTDAVIAVDLQHFGVAIWVDGVVGKSVWETSLIYWRGKQLTTVRT